MNNDINEILKLIGNAYYYGNITYEEEQKYCDYITNLQEENKRLHIQLEDKANEQIKTMYLEYKSRNEKAIEYIGNGNIDIPRKTRDKFVAILKGGNK